MAYGPGGKPVVPPSCPTPQEGFIHDLSEVPFELQVLFSPSMSPPITEVTGIFGVPAEDGERPNRVETTYISQYVDVPWSQRLHTKVGIPEDPTGIGSVSVFNTENEFVEEFRKRLCARVAKCQGKIDKACWALGRQAVIDVVNELTESSDS